jgi:hypothetical protein
MFLCHLQKVKAEPSPRKKTRPLHLAWTALSLKSNPGQDTPGSKAQCPRVSQGVAEDHLFSWQLQSFARRNSKALNRAGRVQSSFPRPRFNASPRTWA